MSTWNNGVYSNVDTLVQNSSTGANNTRTLVGLTGHSQAPFAAANNCDGLTQDSHSDWYLPASDEATLVYTHRNAIGNFSSSNTYLTSSERNGDTNWGINHSNGNVDIIYKNNTQRLRCVRRCDVDPSVSFTDLTNQTAVTTISSNIAQVTGIACPSPFTISGTGSPEYRICSDASCTGVVQTWGSAPGSVSNNQYIQMRLTSAAGGGSRTANLRFANNTDVSWNVASGGDCSGLPGSPPPVGTACADGSVYVGTTPDGSVPMYATRCNYGQTWSGSACTGAAATPSFSANNTAVNNATNNTTGEANTTLLAGTSNAESPYTAAQYCDQLSLHGQTDWYLPAFDEMVVVYNSGILTLWNKNYHSSSINNGNTWNVRTLNSSGTMDERGKSNDTEYVRCVRK